VFAYEYWGYFEKRIHFCKVKYKRHYIKTCHIGIEILIVYCFLTCITGMAFMKKSLVNIVKIDSIDVVLMIKWAIQCVISSLKSHTMRK